ncbi:MAG: hypothetical protein HUK20_10030, partial [Fibrobacter sp.]|nr:hypothetical protein [Fibrobacter sp.]
PSVSLQKSSLGTVTRFTWDDFEQSGWGVKNGGKVVSGAEAAKTLSAIMFRIQGKDGSTGNFNIMSVGPYQGGCGEK